MNEKLGLENGKIMMENGESKRLGEDDFFSRDVAERLGRNVSTVLDYREQWSRDGTASRTPGSWRPRGITEKEDHRIRRTAVTHRTASAAEIRVAVGTTLTQQTNRNRLP
ncbi:transposable element Tc1 transposase [Trichonephila clavipes]|nr:transposable element Tc1 transposase [Trichonephila clavipes]